MSDPREDLVWIGPYTSGEVPLPVTVVIQASDGTPIDLSGAYKAWWLFRRHSQSAGVRFKSDDPAVVIRSATINSDQAGHRGEVTYTWQTTDLSTAGDYEAEMVVDNNSIRLKSRRYAFHVRQSLGEPVY